MKKIMCIVLAMLMLVSCGQTPSNNTSSEITEKIVAVSDIASYTIVMPKTSTMGERDLALDFQKQIEEKLGINLKVSMDSKESAGKEIIIGKTTREESQGEFKYGDYVVKKVGENIVINGGSKWAIKKGLDLILTIATDSFNIPKDDYVVTNIYLHENSTVGGVKLTDFAVTGEDDEIESLSNALGLNTGVMPKTEGENKVYCAIDETLSGSDARVYFDGKDIIVYSSGSGITKAQSASALKDAISQQTGNEVSLDMTTQVLPENLNIVTDEQIAQWRDETDKRIEEIKNTPNMVIPGGATVYYVSNNGKDSNDGKTPGSAWATLSKVSTATLKAGDYVLFERGGYFRGQLKVQSGVTYSAYGEGEKPIICGSTEDGADPKKWTNVGGNIWEYETAFDLDVGTLVFNHGEAHAVKWLVFKNEAGELEEYKTKTKWNGVQRIKTDLEFWHSTENNKIYLYSEENPGKRFSSIEFNRREHAMTGGGSSNVTYDNLTVKYTGAHGIGGGYGANLKVTNCTFEWIGGSIQFVDYSHAAPTPVRFGNGVEIYGGCNGFEVSNCYFNQIYDAAITHQYSFDNGSTSLEDKGQYNVTYKDNVMEYCVYPIEFFLGKIPANNQSCMDNVVYENNLMWYIGDGLGLQRPDNTSPAGIKGWGHINPVKNFLIKDNLMVYSTAMLIHANFQNKNANGEIGVKLENNTVVGEYGQCFGMFGYGTRDVKVNYNETIEEYLGALAQNNNFYFTK